MAEASVWTNSQNPQKIFLFAGEKKKGRGEGVENK